MVEEDLPVRGLHISYAGIPDMMQQIPDLNMCCQYKEVARRRYVRSALECPPEGVEWNSSNNNGIHDDEVGITKRPL